MMSTASASKAAQRAQDLLRRFDLNGDGRLDDDERADAKEKILQDQLDRRMARGSTIPGGAEQFRKQALEIFDRNGDGMLDDEERNVAQKFAAMNQGRSVDSDELKKHFDVNRDGELDPEERAAVEGFLSALRAAGPAQMRDELLGRFDSNQDGKVDEREFSELEKFVRPRVEASADQMRRHDTDRDGKIDDTEWIAARAAIAQWLNGRDVAPRPPTQKREIERARLKAVADEVARRRAERAAAKK
jgi:Ca2+-binding EF-hand superfamily protein